VTSKNLMILIATLLFSEIPLFIINIHILVFFV